MKKKRNKKLPAGMKYISRAGRKWRVRVGSFEMRVTRLEFAKFVRDYELSILASR